MSLKNPKLDTYKSALEQQEHEYKSLVQESLNALCAADISDEMIAETIKFLTSNKILTKAAKAIESKKKFNKEKSKQVPKVYPKVLMKAVEMGEIENVTKYPFFKPQGMRFRLTGFTSKSLFFSWSEKEGLRPTNEIEYYRKSKEPLEIFKRIKKELDSD